MKHLHRWAILGGLGAIAGVATFPHWYPLLPRFQAADPSGWITYRGNGPPDSVTLTLDPGVGVESGDRFMALQDGEPVEVLLCGIKPPPQEPHAREAVAFLQEALDQSMDGTAIVVPYMTKPGAIAGDVFIPVETEPTLTERMPSGEMVLAGLATLDNSLCFTDQVLPQWEEMAKEQGLGLWGTTSELPASDSENTDPQ
ncbi:thermonuclease family protein [Prochlorothrix hollandica]|uniref:thermonuclease family protein n=1 Tax=Prochlorothrix hollandica TaxID=1223 RepID=UPI00034A759B|nr:thermonuclease family protein [Prochlorothrix hollandica]